MAETFLEFEKPVAVLHEKIEGLRRAGTDTDINIAEEIKKLEEKCHKLMADIYEDLKPHQVVQVARHPDRPHTSDYIAQLFTDFDELFGDRHASKGHAIMGGLARFNDQPVMVLGHEKGRSTKDRVAHRFGMANPEGFRRALRLMKMAERFQLPVITLIDTPGANPGIDAEEHNQSEAIARNLLEMSRLRTPIICVIIGEGCSGGALAIGVGDRTLMLQNSYYSVISPEGCASILWKDASKAQEAAEALNLTAPRLKELSLIDEIIKEPLGGAHRDYPAVMTSLRTAIQSQLSQLTAKPIEKVLKERYERYLRIGHDQ